METRNISITLEKARDWYNSNSLDLREVALQAFSEDELKVVNFKDITTFEDAVKVLNLDTHSIYYAIENLKDVSKASVAAFKLNIIRKALNMNYKMSFKEGIYWYPHTSIVLSNSYRKDKCEKETAKVKINCDICTLIGGCSDYSGLSGLGEYYSKSGVCYSNAHIGFLGCATAEIAQHFGKYFAKEIFEAKYGDLIDYEWLQ